MKLTGRPRQFDEEQALERALELFSKQGYAATSMADLVEHTGVSKQSLYNTFGDKRSLFLAALDRYCERSDAGLAGELARAYLVAESPAFLIGLQGGCVPLCLDVIPVIRTEDRGRQAVAVDEV